MTKLALFFTAVLAVVPALAADHLLPENPVDTTDDIRFADAYRSGVEVRMNTESLRPVFTGIRFDPVIGAYRVFALTGKQGFTSEAFDENGSPVWAVGHCDRQIDTVLARRIIRLWTAALREARPNTPEENELVGVDGTTYHFWTRSGLAGNVWSPSDQSTPGLLVDIALRLDEVCAKPDKVRDLRVRLDMLEKKLNTP